MIEITYICDNCESKFTEEVLDICDDIIDNTLPDGWIIINRCEPDEKVLCQDCVEWDELSEDENF